MNDGFLPNTEKLALAASGVGCWSDFSSTLVCNWSSNGDKKRFNCYFGYNSSQSIDRTTHIQGKALKEVIARKLRIKNQNFEALKNQASAEKSRLGIMKVSVWFSKVLLAILMGVLMLTKESIGSIGVLATLTLEDIKNKLKSAGGPGNHGLGQKISSQDFLKFLDPEKGGIQLVEMAFVVISESTTRLAGIETVALRNLETANRM